MVPVLHEADEGLASLTVDDGDGVTDHGSGRDRTGIGGHAGPATDGMDLDVSGTRRSSPADGRPCGSMPPSGRPEPDCGVVTRPYTTVGMCPVYELPFRSAAMAWSAVIVGAWPAGAGSTSRPPCCRTSDSRSRPSGSAATTRAGGVDTVDSPTTDPELPQPATTATAAMTIAHRTRRLVRTNPIVRPSPQPDPEPSAIRVALTGQMRKVAWNGRGGGRRRASG